MEIEEAATITQEELADQVMDFYKKECQKRLDSYLNREDYGILIFNKYNDLCQDKDYFLRADSESSSSVLFFASEWCDRCSEKFFEDHPTIIDVLLRLETENHFVIKIHLATR
jgi:hypothetical protein